MDYIKNNSRYLFKKTTKGSKSIMFISYFSYFTPDSLSLLTLREQLLTFLYKIVLFRFDNCNVDEDVNYFYVSCI